MADIAEIKAVVLCGGLGTRLRSVVGEKQKTMADVAGKPFLDFIIDELKGQGLKKVILCAGYQSQLIDNRYNNDPIIEKISHETEPLGTGGAIWNVQALINQPMNDHPFFVLNGDSFCPVDLKKLLKFHLDHQAFGTVAVSAMEDTEDYGRVDFDERSFVIQKFIEKGKASKSGYVNAGVYCLNKNILGRPLERSSLEKKLFPALVIKSKLIAFPVKERFFDIGTPERYEQAQQYFRKGK